jgi:hypothetical protein
MTDLDRRVGWTVGTSAISSPHFDQKKASDNSATPPIRQNSTALPKKRPNTDATGSAFLRVSLPAFG